MCRWSSYHLAAQEIKSLIKIVPVFITTLASRKVGHWPVIASGSASSPKIKSRRPVRAVVLQVWEELATADYSAEHRPFHSENPLQRAHDLRAPLLSRAHRLRMRSAISPSRQAVGQEDNNKIFNVAADRRPLHQKGADAAVVSGMTKLHRGAPGP